MRDALGGELSHISVLATVTAVVLGKFAYRRATVIRITASARGSVQPQPEGPKTQSKARMDFDLGLAILRGLWPARAP